MTRTMYDAVTPANLPAAATLVAGYLDGHYANTAEIRRTRPNARLVSIAVYHTTNDGDVLDVEDGDATPAEAPGWVVMRRRAGHPAPAIYCNSSTWPAVRAAFKAQQVAEPLWWIAQYDGDPTLFPGTIAKQYASVDAYDTSAVADYWPGIDPEDTMTEQDKQDIINGVLRGIQGGPTRDAIAFADLWWLDHALAGTTTPAMSAAQAGLVAQIHQLVTQLGHAPAGGAATDLPASA